MIFSGFNTYMYDVCFSHPDDSNYYTCVAFVDDVDDDEEDPQEFAERVCKEIWNKYNPSSYYHEMEITSRHIIDNNIYITHTRYNGFNAEMLPAEVRGF